MSEEISSMIVKIDAKSVNEASKELDKFSEKAEEAAAATDDLTEAKKRASSMTAEELKDFERVYQNAVKGAKATRIAAEEERKFTAARKQLLESSDKLYASFRNQIDSLRDVNTASKSLEKVRTDLTKSYKSGQIDINNYSQLLSDVAVKQKEVTTAENIATNAKVNFINKLKEQLTVQNLTKEQLLRYKAAQLGVGSSADIYIRKLTQAKTTTQTLGKSSIVTRNQLATMSTQLMRGNYSGLQTTGLSMIMRGGLANSLSSLISMVNPLNIGIAAVAGLISGVLIPSLFESESATDKLTAAQERLNKVLTTDKISGITFLSSEMNSLLAQNKSLVAALLKSSEEDAETVIKSATEQLKDGFKGMESWWKETPTMVGTDQRSGLNDVLDTIGKITSSGKDLNEMLKSSDLGAKDMVSGVQGKIENYADYFDITKEAATDLLIQLSDIKSETDSIKAAEKINDLISRLSELFTASGSSNADFKKLIEGLSKIASSANDASAKLQFFKLISGDVNKAVDPKSSPFYQYTQMVMTDSQKMSVEIDNMKAKAAEANKIFKEGEKGHVSSADIAAAEAKIKDNYAKKSSKGGSRSTTNLLNASKQQEISLKNQLQALREQSITTTTITSERKKYFDLQAQIQTLESSGNKSKLTAQEKYVLAHKEALLTQYAKNAAIADEVSQYETATKALRKMQEYSTKVATEAQAKQMTFGMTSKNENRYNQLSELDAQREIALKGTSNPTEITKVTEEYNKAKLALQQSWQQEDINQGDWVTGLRLGLEQYAETSQNVFSAATSFAQQSMNSLSSMMTTLVTTGKVSFKDFTKSILTNLIEIINKLIVAQTIQTALGWMGNRASAQGQINTIFSSSGLFYGGGLVEGYASGGSVGYSDKPGGFTGIGDKYKSAGIVHKGEFVFTKEATQRLGVGNLYGLMEKAEKGYANGGYVDGGFVTPAAFNNGGSNSTAVNVTANVTVNMPPDDNKSTTTSNTNAQVMQKQLKAVVQEEISKTFKKSVSQGGDIYNVIKATR